MIRVPHVALLSLEPWDEQWRRNQHLAVQLIEQGLVSRLDFINPPCARSAPQVHPRNRITVITTGRLVPNRLGGTRLVARSLSSSVVADADVLWVNDPVLGAAFSSARVPTLYDVTDDWRTAPAPRRIIRRIVRAEDQLSKNALTVVCSEVLRQRWRERYGVEAALVHNAIDGAAWHSVVPHKFEGPGPHVGYVGTLHEERLDLDLLEGLARDARVGTVHLVGPDAMNTVSRLRVQGMKKVILHGPVPAREVPAWTVGLDILISPHRVSQFTLSLDAIKSYEYLASGRPVVATPTSGFQLLASPSLTVVGAPGFADAVARAFTQVRSPPTVTAPTWAERAVEFGALLDQARGA